MVNILPHLLDLPMSFGDHLHELRRRLIMPLIVLGLIFAVAFYFNMRLKQVSIMPLVQACRIAGQKNCVKLNLDWPPSIDKPMLKSQDLMEPAMISVSVSFYAAFALTIPFLVYQAWKFISVGLMPKERQLAFLFVPACIIFFYLGAIFGYFIGLPYYFAWLIEWAASDPTITSDLRQTYYWDSFSMMTLCFGLIMDIPWLVMVLVRIRMVTIAQLSHWRKVVLMINAVISAIIAPPDAFSMLAMLVPLQLLFEGGLLMSRVMMWRLARREAAEKIRSSGGGSDG